MANTKFYKTDVEPHVRGILERDYGQRFHSRHLDLTTGGKHEFDAVSEDGTIVASIKSLSGKTSGGKRPAAKYYACLAELYYLSLVDAPTRLLVLTTPAWHEMFMRHIHKRLAPGLEVILIELPSAMQGEVDRIKALASGEMSRAVAASEEIIDKGGGTNFPAPASPIARPTNDVPFGCREEILVAFRYLHDLGQSDATPIEVIAHMRSRGSVYADSTIRTHITSRMCYDAPDNHGTTYDDLERVGRGRYRLR